MTVFANASRAVMVSADATPAVISVSEGPESVDAEAQTPPMMVACGSGGESGATLRSAAGGTAASACRGGKVRVGSLEFDD